MERIASLIEQLKIASERNANPAELLELVHLLQAELRSQNNINTSVTSSSRVAVVLPAGAVQSVPQPVILNEPVAAETEKVVEVLQVNEEEVEAELEAIRQKAEYSKQMQAKQVQMKPGFLFQDDEEEVPTLIHQPNYKAPVKEPVLQKELNEVVVAGAPSVNDQLKADQKEVAHHLNEAPVKDLKKAIGINDRFVFINELFRGDETMYERSIKTINNFSIYAEAQYWMERELKIKLGWDNSLPAVQEFYSLVKRRFS